MYVHMGGICSRHFLICVYSYRQGLGIKGKGVLLCCTVDFRLLVPSQKNKQTNRPI